MTEFVCLCGAFFKNITDLREHEEDCPVVRVVHQEMEGRK